MYKRQVSSDDGLNAAGGTDGSGTGFRGDSFSANADAWITLSGGVISIDAEGDGIDSNGSLTVSGGEIYVYGPERSGNGALDYNGEASITGGLVVAFGPSGMAQNFGTSSTQGAMLVSISGSAGDTVTLTASDGTELVSCQSQKAYSSVAVSYTHLDVYKRQMRVTHWRKPHDSKAAFQADRDVYKRQELL